MHVFFLTSFPAFTSLLALHLFLASPNSSELCREDDMHFMGDWPSSTYASMRKRSISSTLVQLMHAFVHNFTKRTIIKAHTLMLIIV